MASKTVSTRKVAARNGHIEEAGLRIEIVKVTPDLAETWLKKNTKNRSLRPRIVAQYARDMAAGLWQVTGEAIKFDVNGALSDGQHRLCAVIEAKTAVQMLIVRGVTEDAQSVMDTGAKRVGADALQLAGHSYTALTAAAVRLAMNWEAGRFVSARQTQIDPITNSELLGFVDENPDMVNAARMTSLEYRRIPASGSVIAFTFWATSRIAPGASQRFYEDLANLVTTGVGDPRHALLRRLQSARDNRERMGQVQQADAFFRAWNAVRDDKRLSRINPHHATDNFTDPR